MCRRGKNAKSQQKDLPNITEGSNARKTEKYKTTNHVITIYLIFTLEYYLCVCVLLKHRLKTKSNQ